MLRNHEGSLGLRHQLLRCILPLSLALLELVTVLRSDMSHSVLKDTPEVKARRAWAGQSRSSAGRGTIWSLAQS